VVVCGAMEERAPFELQWKSCPASMHPIRAVFAWLVIIFVAIAIGSNSIILGIVLTATLIATQGTFLFPTKYFISEDGLRAKYLIRSKFYTWARIRRATFYKELCYVCTRKKPSNRDAWSGMSIFYGKKRDEVVSALKCHLAEDVVT
jgi:hypothetical protein